MQNLTSQQIESIRTNIKNRGIETIDLEYEMVDHIATAVEEKMAEGMNFYDAYKAVMLSFGPFGMEKLQSKHNTKLINEGWKLAFRYLLTYFKFPKIVMSLSVALFIYLISFSGEKSVLFFKILFFANIAINFYLYWRAVSKVQKTKFTQMVVVYKLFYLITTGPLFAWRPIFEGFYDQLSSVIIFTSFFIIQRVALDLYRDTILVLIERYQKLAIK